MWRRCEGLKALCSFFAIGHLLDYFQEDIMPIARLRPDAPSPIAINLPKIQSPDYKSVVGDEKNIPLQSLIAYVEGAPWTVQYYSQLLSKHNDLKDYDPSQPDIYQQYTRINNTELRVSSPLTDSYDAETGITKVTGAGHLPTCIVPNVGDLFIANVDSGDDAFFRISTVERKTFNRQSVFYIEYDLTGLTAQHPEQYTNLNEKVQRTYFFHKDRLIDNLDPLVTPEENETILTAKSFLEENIRYYFKTFYNKNYSAMVLPYQRTTFYDALIVRFILRIVNSFQADEIRLLNNITIDHEPYLSQPTIWDMLLQRDYSMLQYINKNMGWVGAVAFFRDASIAGARYQRMNYFMYPIDADKSVELTTNTQPKLALLDDLTETQSNHSLSGMLNETFNFQNTTVPILPPVFENGSYVFTPAFYSDTTGKSLLETLTIRYLKQETLDLSLVMRVVKNYHQWTRLEQYYFSPVIWVLLKSIVGDISP